MTEDAADLDCLVWRLRKDDLEVVLTVTHLYDSAHLARVYVGDGQAWTLLYRHSLWLADVVTWAQAERKKFEIAKWVDTGEAAAVEPESPN